MKKIYTCLLFLNVVIVCAQKTATTQPQPKQPDSKEKEYMSIEEYERKYNTPSLDAYTIADEMPEFPGGNDSMNKFIKENITYPQKAKLEKIGGKCFIKFIVLNEGSITDIKVEKGIIGCSECDSEAIRVIKLMPKWKPGKINGNAVNVYYLLPINFVP